MKVVALVVTKEEIEVVKKEIREVINVVAKEAVAKAKKEK